MQGKPSGFSSTRTLLFVICLCLACALVLSVLAERLKTPQKHAKELYRSKQLLLAAQILDYNGYFLVDGTPTTQATDQEILQTFETRVLTRLTNDQGQVLTFEDAGIDETTYLLDHAKIGYAQLPYKLIYLIKQSSPSFLPYGYVIPVNGYGLWDAIYGYLGIAANGNTVLGMTWYEQKETPGLGGEIALPEWQEQFQGKEIFQKNPDGTTNFARAPLGIEVVKTTVKETFGTSPRSDSAVDGIAGASITVTG
ncbi:MAG: NADH:ubiquinone reductase (Na(+)-transporting) subunit C, partial [Bdellovibrionales bacterium]|nr:NADH:ubiquinone reductase (Na(+)-transporting) subunit C [Bdellovibrionales bacterium]